MLLLGLTWPIQVVVRVQSALRGLMRPTQHCVSRSPAVQLKLPWLSLPSFEVFVHITSHDMYHRAKSITAQSAARCNDDAPMAAV